MTVTTTSTIDLVDRTGSRASYHAATDRRHFQSGDDEARSNELVALSRFSGTHLTRIEDLLDVAIEQRGNLDGDDRNLFIAEGCDPKSFLDGVRYLYVREGGTVDAIYSAGFAPNIMLEVRRSKPGAPCTLVRHTKSSHRSNFGVIVIETDPVTGQEFVATAHPGTPRQPNTSGALDALEGEFLSIGRVREILGRDFWIETWQS